MFNVIVTGDTNLSYKNRHKSHCYLVDTFCSTKKNNLKVRVMVFNVTFNNISDISWRSVLLIQETEIPRGNHRPVASH